MSECPAYTYLASTEEVVVCERPLGHKKKHASTEYWRTVTPGRRSEFKLNPVKVEWK